MTTLKIALHLISGLGMIFGFCSLERALNYQETCQKLIFSGTCNDNIVTSVLIISISVFLLGVLIGGQKGQKY